MHNQTTIHLVQRAHHSLCLATASSLQRLASHFCSLSSACGGATGRLAVLAHRKMDSTVPRTSILRRPPVRLGLPLSGAVQGPSRVTPHARRGLADSSQRSQHAEELEPAAAAQAFFVAIESHRIGPPRQPRPARAPSPVRVRPQPFVVIEFGESRIASHRAAASSDLTAQRNTHCLPGCFPRSAAEAAKVASACLEALGAAASGTVCASARSRARQACARARHQGSSRCAATRAIISAQTMAQGGEIEIKWVGEASTATKGRVQFRKAKAPFQEGQVEEASWRDRRYFMIIILVTLSNWPRLSRRIHRLHCLEELQSRPLSDVHFLQVLVRQHAKCFHIHLLLRSKASGCP